MRKCAICKQPGKCKIYLPAAPPTPYLNISSMCKHVRLSLVSGTFFDDFSLSWLIQEEQVTGKRMGTKH